LQPDAKVIVDLVAHAGNGIRKHLPSVREQLSRLIQGSLGTIKKLGCISYEFVCHRDRSPVLLQSVIGISDDD
jgi:hypothetical protein